MVGRIILGGGGNSEKAFEVEELFFKKAKNIVYIPLARHGEFDKCLEWFTNTVRLHNKEAKIKMITDLSGRFNLQYYDSLYIGGGNTYLLLKRIKENGFGKKIIDFYKNGGSIFGGSAGAIIFGRDIKISSVGKKGDPNEVDMKETSGLNICNNKDIHCHYGLHLEKEDVRYMKESKHDIIGIPEESALLIENNQFQVIGKKPITVITKPQPIVYKVGDIIEA